jgi:hypothetical protein
MTSELKPNEIICEVVCASPKNYAYRTVNTVTAESVTVYIARGITINYHAFQLVNFSNMKEMILSMDADEIVIARKTNKIKR